MQLHLPNLESCDLLERDTYVKASTVSEDRGIGCRDVHVSKLLLCADHNGTIRMDTEPL